jgi:hypothetical protein
MELEFRVFSNKNKPKPQFSFAGGFSMAGAGSGNGAAKPHGKTLRSSFMKGMGIRVSQRLRKMKNDLTPKGTGIMVLKNALVEQEFNKLNMKLKDSGKTSISNPNAFRDGLAAGDKVNLTTGINGGSNITGYLR